MISLEFTSGSDESSLMITDLTEDDSGSYECRIMVEQTVSVTHSLSVANMFSIHPDPPNSLVNVPLRQQNNYLHISILSYPINFIRGNSRFGCKTSDPDSEIEWTRDGGKFSSTNSYHFKGNYLEITDATIEVMYIFSYLLEMTEVL